MAGDGDLDCGATAVLPFDFGESRWRRIDLACERLVQFGTIQVSASPASGYGFTGFSGALTQTTSPQTLSLNANVSVAANFVALPSITNISPTSGPPGSNVNITGTGFGAGGAVTFNGIAAQIVSWSATSVVATVPANATTGNISLTANGFQSTYMAQSFLVTAVSASVTPASGVTLGPGGTQQFTASVTGTTNQQVMWSATLGAISSSGFYTAPTTITAQQTATVTATSQAGGTPGTSVVTLVPTPATISSLSLSQGPAQVGLMISGSNFGSGGAVSFTPSAGGDPVNLQVVPPNPPTLPTPWTSTAITVQIAASLNISTGSTAGTIKVTPTGSATSNGISFTVVPAFGCK